MTVPEVIWDKWQMQLRFLPVFLLGRYIVEQEQQGAERAKYGAKVLDSLSSYLNTEEVSQEAMLRECGSSIWLTKTERMKLSNRELDNLNRLLELSNSRLDN